MKSLTNMLSYSAIILFVVTIMTGCSVGIRPAYYDLPPLDSDQYYYGEPVYSQYYNVSPPPPNYNYNYGSGYDPWTMGTYYDYSPPQRTGYSSGSSSSSSTNSVWDSTNRPSMRDRGTVSSNDSKAPANDQSYLRRERTAQRDSSSSTSDSSTSSGRKVRRNTNQSSSQSDQDQSSSSQSDQSNVKKHPQSQTQDSSGTNTDEKKDDEKERQKRSAIN